MMYFINFSVKKCVWYYFGFYSSGLMDNDGRSNPWYLYLTVTQNQVLFDLIKAFESGFFCSEKTYFPTYIRW